MSAMCPICSKDDTIQRVSAVVSSGRATGSFSGPTSAVTYSDKKWGVASGHTTLRGDTVSELAETLAPPAEPKPPGNLSSLFIGLGAIFWGGAFGVMALASVSLALQLLLGLGDSRHSSGEYLAVFVSVPVLGAIAAFVFHEMKRNREKHSEMEEKHSSDKSVWETEMKRWNSLYYCHRDDIVFEPETGETCQPQDIKQLYATSSSSK